ncbi:MAG: hypothetical protein HW375_811 [Anaerolineales bacterium]|nr:hypothetical protein [Anaerolineales bacterium]
MNAPAFLGMMVILLAASPLIYLGGRLSGKDRASPVAQTLAVLALGLAWRSGSACWWPFSPAAT